MNRKPFIAGNWKMYNTIKESVELITQLKRDLSNVEYADIAVCPPFTALSDSREILIDSNIKLGAQDLYWEKEGAYTGEVSARMLKDVGCEFVIIGHSERRKYFKETNEDVNKKIKAALAAGLGPIACVGETLEEREHGKTFDVVKAHVHGALTGLSNEDVLKLVIAYEPVWAIGTGKTATPGQAQEVHSYIRELLTELYNEEISQAIRIQYGGSVKPENIKDLIAQADIDGALVGGASLKSDSFVGIVKGSK
ncbi:MAG: triose-phosphate isomerase [Candidatus Omnitrophota bacterium]